MLTVYRIEDDKGGGPYRGDNQVGCEFEHYYETHPTPWDDGIDFRHANSDYVCGFDSVVKLVEWFNSRDRDVMHNAGYSLSVYQADDVARGDKQVMFNPRTARKQMTLSLAA